MITGDLRMTWLPQPPCATRRKGVRPGSITLKAGPIRWPARPSPSGCSVSSRHSQCRRPRWCRGSGGGDGGETQRRADLVDHQLVAADRSPSWSPRVAVKLRSTSRPVTRTRCPAFRHRAMCSALAPKTSRIGSWSRRSRSCPFPVGRRGVTARRVVATSLLLQRSLPGRRSFMPLRGWGWIEGSRSCCSSARPAPCSWG